MKRIKEARELKGWSQTALAEAIGSSQQQDREQSNPNPFKIVPGGFAIAA